MFIRFVKSIFFSEIHESETLHWKVDDDVFLETHNFSAMLYKVRTQPFVIFVGLPGSGKTATARDIALILQEEGYEIVPTINISDIKDYCDPLNSQVFLIDDVVGVFGLDLSMLDMLHRYQIQIMKSTILNSKILMTCREVVFRHEDIS